MTSQTFPPESTGQATETTVSPVARSWDRVERTLPFIASLKLTVVLFTMSIFLVFVGTLAQVNQDMWQVINKYFHSYLVWIDFQVFLPASWFPNLQNVYGGFPFLGGLTIGFLLLVNLLAAHLTRFRIQATGNRMLFGIITAAIGVLLTWLVVASGNSSDGFQAEPILSYRVLWKVFIYGLVVCWLGSLVGLWKMYSSYHQRKLEFILLSCGSGLLGIGSIWLVIQLEAAYLGDAGMRILWQLVQGGAAGIVMLAGCILLFRRRGGIVLIHSGIGLMMLGELLVGTYAVEQQISLREGETLNYAMDTRSTELAIVDPSSDEGDEVVVVPLWLKGRSSQFLSQKVIQNRNLPFDIEILDYYKNAELIDVDPQKDDQPQNPATAGFGTKLIAQEVRSSSGADSDGTIDLAAAYVKLTEKGTGTQIGTFLLAQQMAMQDLAEEVRLNDKTYQLSLRFERDYKDYQLRLHDVVKEDYAGTDVPRHYASDINIFDTKRNIDQDVKVWMNNPVRYAGETFYQSGYRKIPAGPAGKEVEISTIQIVENTGWMIPYVSCMLVMIGLLAHFCGTLSRFLKRLTRGPVDPAMPSVEVENGQDPAPTVLPERTKTGAPPVMRLLLPMIVVVLCGGYVLKQASTPAGGEGQEAALYNFGTLPIVFEGRVKPYDTLARNSLKVLSGRESFHYGAVQARLDGNVKQIEEAPDGGHYITIQDDQHYLPPGLERNVKKGDTVKAGQMLSGAESRPAISWLLDVISDPDSEKTRSHQVFKIDHPDLVMNLFDLKRRKGGRYSIGELEPKLEEFQKQVQQARGQPAEQLNSYQRKMIELSTKIMIYVRIRDSHFRPPTDLSPDQAARMLLALTQFQQRDVPLTVPSEKTNESWQSFSMAHARLYVHDLADQLQAHSNSALAASLARSSITDLDLMRDFYRRQGMEPPSDAEIARVFLQMPADVKQTFATLKESETSQM
ncbi:MAG: cytochrome c biogenesis protein ResB, partial [Pirellulaceae bacterium]